MLRQPLKHLYILIVINLKNIIASNHLFVVADYLYRKATTMKKENWKPVVGYEGLYEVSSIGRVRSLNYQKTKKKVIMSLQAKVGAYIKVGLKDKDGNYKYYRVHRLVAIAFLPEHSPEQRYVNHINGNKQDNRVENLE